MTPSIILRRLMATAAIALSSCLTLTSWAQSAQTTQSVNTATTPQTQQTCYDVVPLPRSIQLTDGAPFVLDGEVRIGWKAGGGTEEEEGLRRVASFLQSYIEERTKLHLPIIRVSDKGDATSRIIELSLDSNVQEKEGYKIFVSSSKVSVTGCAVSGVFYGVQTLRKSLPALADNTAAIWPAAVIEDYPRFRWRGMMLDCVRHFFPLEFVKRYVDFLALHNMNTFHWHLTDDQGWRLEIKSCPELTQIGAWRDGTVIGNNSDVDDHTPHGGFYTQDEARELIAYAAERFITVIPEFEMPGHTKAFLASYPELGCTGGPYRVGHHWGVYNDVLCIGNEDLYPRLQMIVDEILDLFPTEYIHIGGDETPTVRWDNCPKCQAVQLKKDETLQGHFTSRLEAYILSKGKKMIGWDEVLATGAPASATIMAWRGTQAGVNAAEAGHDVIMAPLTHCYFDYYQSENYFAEPSVTGMWPITVEKVYNLEPVPSSMSSEAKSHILGVQANLWCEHITVPATAEYMVLPRMAALAEVQWADEAQRNYDAFRLRLDRLVRIYDEQGWQYALHLWPDRQPKNRWELDY